MKTSSYDLNILGIKEGACFLLGVGFGLYKWLWIWYLYWSWPSVRDTIGICGPPGTEGPPIFRHYRKLNSVNMYCKVLSLVWIHNQVTVWLCIENGYLVYKLKDTRWCITGRVQVVHTLIYNTIGGVMSKVQSGIVWSIIRLRYSHNM
jgi:hypothetical protein